MKAMRYLRLMLLAVLMCGAVAACDKLSDDDDMVVEVLPGTWAFSYELVSEEISAGRILFRYRLPLCGWSCRRTEPASCLCQIGRAHV